MLHLSHLWGCNAKTFSMDLKENTISKEIREDIYSWGAYLKHQTFSVNAAIVWASHRWLLPILGGKWYNSRGAFLWDDPDQDQWSKITRNMLHQMNRWINSGQGIIGSFDVVPWSEWSRITDPDPDHLKGTHPRSAISVIYHSTCISEYPRHI